MNKFAKSPKLHFFFFCSFYPNFNNSCQFYFRNASWILLIFSNAISAVSVQVQLISWLNFSFTLWIYTVGRVNQNEKSTANPTFQWFPAVKGQRTKDKARPFKWHARPLWSVPPDALLLFLNSLLLHKLESPLQRRLIFIEGQRGKITYEHKIRSRIWILQAMFLTTVLCCPPNAIAITLVPDTHPTLHKCVLNKWNEELGGKKNIKNTKI